MLYCWPVWPLFTRATGVVCYRGRVLSYGSLQGLYSQAHRVSTRLEFSLLDGVCNILLFSVDDALLSRDFRCVSATSSLRLYIGRRRVLESILLGVKHTRPCLIGSQVSLFPTP